MGRVGGWGGGGGGLNLGAWEFGGCGGGKGGGGVCEGAGGMC